MAPLLTGPERSKRDIQDLAELRSLTGQLTLSARAAGDAPDLAALVDLRDQARQIVRRLSVIVRRRESRHAMRERRGQ